MKHYKIKFAGEDPKEACEEFVERCGRKGYGRNLIEKHKKKVIFAADDKNEVRQVMNHIGGDSYTFGYTYSFGEEGEDYSIKKVDKSDSDIER